ncbi:MAG: THUMP domain-containing protein [Candidatus Woesearchaeota archaeon]
MKFIAITEPGLEDIAVLDVKERCSVVAKKGVEFVSFESEWEEALRLCYRGQSIRRVLLFLHEWTVSDEILPKTTKPILDSLKPFIKGLSFKVEVDREGEHLFQSADVAEEIGALIHDELKAKVSLESPELLVHCFVCDKKAILGIDIVGFEMSKRSYKVFNHPNTLRGTIAYGALRIAGMTKKTTVLDPHCRSGEIPIEAALFAYDFPVWYYDKEKFSFSRLSFVPKKDVEAVFNEKDKPGTAVIYAFDPLFAAVTATKKNSKIAGITKHLICSKYDIEWLDTKLDKNSIDLLITRPVEATKRTPAKDAEKFMKELKYQIDFIVKPKGAVFLIKHQKPSKPVASIHQGQECLFLESFDASATSSK